MGELVEFYYPRNRIVATPFKAEEPSAQMPATHTHRARNMRRDRDILILIRRKDGSLNFTTNLKGLSDMLLLMEEIKLYALQHPEEVGDEHNKRRTTNGT